jgi:hypothetical protein
MYYSKAYAQMCEASKEVQQMRAIKEVCDGIAPFHHYKACRNFYCIGLWIGDFVYIKKHSYYCVKAKKYKKTSIRTFGYVTEIFSPAKYLDDEKNYYPSCSISINRGWSDNIDGDVSTMNYAGNVENDHILVRNLNCTYRSQIVWLPRQDQIFSICCKMGNVDYVALIKDIAKDIKDNRLYLNGIDQKSGEQVALAFFMYNFHNKLWNGELWI